MTSFERIRLYWIVLAAIWNQFPMFTGYLGGAKAAKYGMRDSIFPPTVCPQLTQMICCMHPANKKINKNRHNQSRMAAFNSMFLLWQISKNLLTHFKSEMNSYVLYVPSTAKTKKNWLMEFFDKQSPPLTVLRTGWMLQLRNVLLGQVGIQMLCFCRSTCGDGGDGHRCAGGHSRHRFGFHTWRNWSATCTWKAT